MIEAIIAAAACFAIASLGRPPFATSLAFPLFKELVFDLGWFFVIFGALSDKVGRKPIVMAGCLLAALTYFPIFKGLTQGPSW